MAVLVEMAHGGIPWKKVVLGGAFGLGALTLGWLFSAPQLKQELPTPTGSPPQEKVIPQVSEPFQASAPARPQPVMVAPLQTGKTSTPVNSTTKVIVSPGDRAGPAAQEEAAWQVLRLESIGDRPGRLLLMTGNGASIGDILVLDAPLRAERSLVLAPRCMVEEPADGAVLCLRDDSLAAEAVRVGDRFVRDPKGRRPSE